MIRHSHLFPVLLCSLSLLALAGCESTGTNDDLAAADATPATPPRNLRAGVPPQAQQVSEGKGSLSYIATESGQVYLYDLHANRLVGNYNLRPGQELILSESGRATLDGNEVALNGEVSRSRTYIAYFLPLPAGAGAESDQTYRITPAPPAGGGP